MLGDKEGRVVAWIRCGRLFFVIVDQDLRRVGCSEGGAGRINLNQIHVEYRIDYPPELIKSIASVKIDEDSGLAAPIDLNDYFTDDWDAGRLRFEMTNATNTQHVYFFLDGSQLSVGTLTPNWCGVATFIISLCQQRCV